MTTVSVRARILLAFGLLSSVAILGGIKLIPGLAHNTPKQDLAQGSAVPVWQVKEVEIYDPNKRYPPHENLSPSEKVIENRIPRHLPIRVEIRGLDKEELLSNLEIRVTNKAAKPIYLLSFQLVFPDVLSPDGRPLIIPIQYGRTKLELHNEPISADDVPIKYGESVTLKVPVEQISGFDAHLNSSNTSYTGVKVVQLFFGHLTFGDKTGFTTTGGIPFPDERQRPPDKENKILKGLPVRGSGSPLSTSNNRKDIVLAGINQGDGTGPCCQGSCGWYYLQPYTCCTNNDVRFYILDSHCSAPVLTVIPTYE